MRKLHTAAINDSNYVTSIYEDLPRYDGKRRQRRVWVCPFYERWCNMIKRCYSVAYLKRQPTYEGCVICDDWLTFSKFKAWMETQDWEGKHLDKDLLGNGKRYSPETCIYVDRLVNNFLNVNTRRRGDYPLGVSFHKVVGKYQAECTNPLKDISSFIGYYATEIEAHKAWQAKKHEYACLLAEEQQDPRVAGALRQRYAPDKDWSTV